MRSRVRRFSSVGVMALCAAVLFPVTSAAAATTYKVAVGGFLKTAPAESNRFFPSQIDVHQGDTLDFAIDGFHSATMLPVGTDPVGWVDTNATLGSSQPYALVQPDPEDDTFKIGNGALSPSDPACGGASQPACSFDGSSVVSSGVPFFSNDLGLTATVNASAGSSFYVVCIVHGPSMRLRVDVVASSDPASTTQDLKAANKAAVAQDSDSAAALNAKFSSMRTWHAAADGHRVWDAWAGVDNAHVSLYGMYPSTLTIRKGDTVQWHFDSLTFEFHTVTFPKGTAKEIANVFSPTCDPDGDEGPLSDNPPDLHQFPFCNDPSQLEIEFDPRFVPPQGNGVLRGKKDLESSGVRGSTSVQGDANYDLTFDARSSGDGFRYVCMIHTFMQGTVVVR